jgi:ABC-type cobalamin/Fe3+-siderophores transport system ATPase subunit
MYPTNATRQVNCALLGRPGNGKSSLINSVYQTVTNKNGNLCDEGSVDRSCTLKYACCTALCEANALPLLLFDTKGLPDSKDRSTKSTIQMLLKGKLKPAHSMNNPKWKDCYLFPDKTIKIDVVLFVYAYGTVFPHRLATCVAEEALQRNVSVIPAITFYDRVQHDDQLNVHVDCCARIFNTHPVCLTNLSAISKLETTTTSAAVAATAGGVATVQREKSRKAVTDLVSQAMIFGQQHHRHKKYNTSQPLQYKHNNGNEECIVS